MRPAIEAIEAVTERGSELLSAVFAVRYRGSVVTRVGERAELFKRAANRWTSTYRA
jgi:hypothetical protein